MVVFSVLFHFIMMQEVMGLTPHSYYTMAENSTAEAPNHSVLVYTIVIYIFLKV